MSKILNVPMQENDANAKTVKEYLIELLLRVVSEQEGFSGKRPFGNSGWMGELETALVAAELVEGTLDEDGYLEDADSDEAHSLLIKAIREL